AGSVTRRGGELRAPVAPMFGSGSILLLDGAEHMRQRKLMLPPFHGARMASYGELIAAAAERELESWPLHRAFPLQPRMQAIAFEVIMRAVFGLHDVERRGEVGGPLRRAVDVVANAL